MENTFERIQVTQELIERGQSGMGGWNREQLKLIGVPWPPIRGWRHMAIGSWITKGDAELFVNLRGVTLKRNKAYRRNAPLADLLLKFDAEL